MPGAPVPAPTVPTPAKKPADAAPTLPNDASPTVPTPPTTPTTPVAPVDKSAVTPSTPSPAPVAPATTSIPTAENSGMLTIWVPSEAKVSINGMLTPSTGSRREYVSFGLQPGMSYKYDVHAEIVRDGKIVEENKSVTLVAGERGALAFGFNVAKTAEGLATAN